MKTDTSPLISKLTLLVLTLILACLVLLVVRSYQGQRAVPPVAASDAEPAVPEKEAPRAVTPPLAPVIKRAVPAAITSPVPTNPPANAQVQAEPATQEPNVIGRVSFGPTDHRPSVIHETLAANGSALLAGMVTLKGTPKPETTISLESMGPTCGAFHTSPPTTRHFVVGPEGQLANVVVYIKKGLSRKFGPTQPGPLIDQVGCMFEPYISAVVAGQTFQIRNSDPTLHNLHSTPKVKGNKEFNIGQGTKGQVNTLSFALPEMFLRMKCDVHPWMFTYISVFDHPYFAITDTNGFFQLPAQIPAGEYIIAASHLKLGTELQTEVRLREGEQRSIKFEFEVPNPSTALKKVDWDN